MLPHLVHITALRGRYYQPHFTGDITEDMILLVLVREAACLECRLLGNLSLQGIRELSKNPGD